MKKRFHTLPRWLFALALVCSLMTAAASATDAAPSETEAYRSMIALKDTPFSISYTDSTRKTPSNPDGTVSLSFPEGLKEGRSWTDENDVYVWKGGFETHGHGCVAFAYILSDVAFGDLPASKIYKPSGKSDAEAWYDNLKVGDILRWHDTDPEDNHSVIILEKYDDHVVAAEGNWNSIVHWGREIPKNGSENADGVLDADYAATRYGNAGKAYRDLQVAFRYRVNGVERDRMNLYYGAYVGSASSTQFAIQSLLNYMENEGAYLVPGGKETEYAAYTFESADTAKAVGSYTPGEAVDIYVDYSCAYTDENSTPLNVTLRHYTDGVWDGTPESFTDYLVPKAADRAAWNDAIEAWLDGYYWSGARIEAYLQAHPDRTRYSYGLSKQTGEGKSNYNLGEDVVISIYYTTKKADVTFVVEGGAWDDGYNSDIAVTAINRENSNGAPKFYSTPVPQIPPVGNKPNVGYLASGAWYPSDPGKTTLKSGQAYTFTYTYDKIATQATFKIVGGAWSDGTTADKTVTASGFIPGVPALLAGQIPVPGAPKSGFQSSGAWNTVPRAFAALTGSGNTYTYTFDGKSDDSVLVCYVYSDASGRMSGIETYEASQDSVSSIHTLHPPKTDAASCKTIVLSGDGKLIPLQSPF